MNEDKLNQIYSCPIEYTLDQVSGKWKLVILWHLSNTNIMRYGEIKKSLNGITHKMLSQQLKELESDGFINRVAYPVVPPKVEYSLTEKGNSFLPILKMMSEWGNRNLEESK